MFNQVKFLRFLFKLTAGLLVFLFLISPLTAVVRAEELVEPSVPQDNTQIEDLNQVEDVENNKILSNTITEEESADGEDQLEDIAVPTSPFQPDRGPKKIVQAKIDEVTGALTYEYSFAAPLGRNNFDPNIKLIYNSQSLDKDSIFSAGWSLSLPFIERVNRKGINKLYDENIFSSSLDGEMIFVSGDEYRAKVDIGAFNKYLYLNNIWHVIDKNGVTYKFGATSASRQDDPNNSTRIFRWMIDEIRDSNNNVIKYEYIKDSGQIYISAITYTGHGSDEGIYRIEFSRENRNDSLVSYKTGFFVKTNSLINEITILVNNEWVKKYSLHYSSGDNGVTSLLSSIIETGKDENNNIISLPSNSFEYQVSPNQDHWLWDQTAQTPVAINYYLGTYMADINGDGYEDIIQGLQLQNGIDEIKTAYINNGEGGWIENQNYAPPIVFAWWIVGTGPDGLPIRFIDVNGDNLVDMVYKKGSSKAAYLNTGNGWSADNSIWYPPQSLQEKHINWSPAYFANINGDGLPDMIRAVNTGQSIHTTVSLNNGNGWDDSINGAWSSPVEINSAFGSILVDVNGDGLDDIIESTAWPSTSFQNTYLNNGHGGWDISLDYQPPVIFAYRNIGGTETQDFGVRMADVNGDGLVDILRGGVSSLDHAAFINTGSGWVQDQNWKSPDTFVSQYWNQPPAQFVGNNGDSMIDIYKATQNGSIITTRHINKEKKVNLLKKLNYSGGGSTEIIYQSTPLYKNGSTFLNPKLPTVIDTVQVVKDYDGIGNVNSTTYSYEGGYYYFNNAFDSKLAGFSKVTKTDNLSKVVTFYHQGNDSNSSQGEYQDHVSKIGRVYRQEVYDLNNNLFSKTINQWDKFDLSNNRNFVKLTRSVQSTHDGNASHRDSAETYEYDNTNGNKIKTIQWGEVSVFDDGSFSDLFNDKFTSELTYATGSANNVIALPATETMYDQALVKLKESRYYYDNLPLGQVSLGNQTKQAEWKDGLNYISTQKVYNQYGLVVTEIDPLGRQTNYTYDAYNLYPIAITNPLNQVNGFSYDYSSGKVIEAVDVNGKIFTTYYDGLDRPLVELQPDQTANNLSVVKTTYEYDDTPNASRVKKSNYLDANNVVDHYTYFDGLGRKIQERSEAENSGQYTVRDFMYQAEDLLSKESLPYFSSGSARTAATTAAALYTNYNYDAMKRVISAQNAVGTTVNVYDDWKTSVTDAKGKIKTVYRDAYNNLVRVDEHNGVAVYSTYYQWNLLKKLTKITDALGNIRNFNYDSLGRVLVAEDLHAVNDSTFGVWHYDYDYVGNLISKVAPNSKEIIYTYDNLNRILSEDAVGTDITEVVYVYDNCLNGIGRLCSVVNPSLRTLIEYDALGQLTKENKKIGRGIYETNYNYDRQGNQTTIINPDDSRVVYVYNNAGLVDSIKRQESTDLALINVITNIDYNPVGLPELMSYGNGVVTTNTYDASELYRLRHKLTSAGNKNVQDLTYTYDQVGNIIQIVDASNTQTAKTTNYTYDDLHRLLSATISNSAAQGVDGEGDQNQIQTFTYDAIGNILSKSDVGNYSYSGNVGDSYANPHAVTSAGQDSYTYDENGNLVSMISNQSDEANSFSWDYANRLSSVVVDGVVSNYEYDSSGQRIKEITDSGVKLSPTKNYSTDEGGAEKHIFLGDVAVASIDGTASSALAYNIHADHLTSSSVITNNDQQVDELTDYYSFGTIRLDEQAGERNEKRKFTGHEYDVDTGLTYANARYYSGTMGRWLSQDSVFQIVTDPSSVEESAGATYDEYLADPQMLNSYSYVTNNPLKYIDITGNARNAPMGSFGSSMAQGQRDIGNFMSSVAQSSAQSGGIMGYGGALVYSAAASVAYDTANVFDPQASAGDKAMSVAMLGLTVATGGEGKAVAGAAAAAKSTAWTAKTLTRAEAVAQQAKALKGLTSTKAINYTKQFYKAADTIPGGTAGAVHWEKIMGKPIKDVYHAAQKAPDLLRGMTKNLNKFIGRDLQAVKSMVNKLTKALR